MNQCLVKQGIETGAKRLNFASTDGFFALTLPGKGEVEHCKIYDFYVPPGYLADGLNTVKDLWCVAGRATEGLARTAVRGRRPKHLACWQGGDSIKEGRRSKSECLPEVVKAMKACLKETGAGASKAKMVDPKQVSRHAVQSQCTPLPESRRSDQDVLQTAESETVPAGKEENAELLQPSLLVSKPGRLRFTHPRSAAQACASMFQGKRLWSIGRKGLWKFQHSLNSRRRSSLQFSFSCRVVWPFLQNQTCKRVSQK